MIVSHLTSYEGWPHAVSLKSFERMGNRRPVFLTLLTLSAKFFVKYLWGHSVIFPIAWTSDYLDRQQCNGVKSCFNSHSNIFFSWKYRNWIHCLCQHKFWLDPSKPFQSCFNGFKSLGKRVLDFTKLPIYTLTFNKIPLNH